MQLLENLYEKPPTATTYFGRKTQISAKNTLLLGPRRCGKTAIILDHLSQYDPAEYLYIDRADARVTDSLIFEQISTFLSTHPIRLLVVENYDSSFKIPVVSEVILSSDDHTLKVEHFSTLHVRPLDFEEYIAFDKRHFNVSHLFNLFANHGRLPACAMMEEFENRRYLQESLRLILPDTLSFTIFQFYAVHQSHILSLHQVYQGLKESVKISKDKLYMVSEMLQKKGLLYLVPKLDFPKAAKKVYLGDFAFKNALTFDKDFMRRFENIVHGELVKLESPLYYTENIEFYFPKKKLAILCIPFLPPELIIRRFTRLLPQFQSLHVKSVQVITVGNEGFHEKEGITCEILPFWDWALQL